MALMSTISLNKAVHYTGDKPRDVAQCVCSAQNAHQIPAQLVLHQKLPSSFRVVVSVYSRPVVWAAVSAVQSPMQQQDHLFTRECGLGIPAIKQTEHDVGAMLHIYMASRRKW